MAETATPQQTDDLGFTPAANDDDLGFTAASAPASQQGPTNPYGKEGFFESLGHTFGIGKEEAAERAAHPVRGIVEAAAGPAYQIAKGLYGEGKRVVGEATQAFQADNPYSRAQHAIQATPFIGGGITRGAEQLDPKQGVQNPFNPAVLGTVTGTSLQAAPIAAGGYEGVRGALRARLIGSPLRGVVKATDARAGALDAAIDNTDQGGGPSSPNTPRSGPPAPAAPAVTPSQSGLITGGTPALDPEMQAFIRESSRKAYADAQPPEVEPATPQTASNAPQAAVLEQEPGGTSTPLLDEVIARQFENTVAGHPERLNGLRAEHGASTPGDIKALMDAIDQSGDVSFRMGDFEVGHEQAAASIALEQILAEMEGRNSAPTPAQELEMGKAYIQSVLAGIQPVAAAAALHLTPEQQEMAHVAAALMPNAMSAASLPTPSQPPPAPQQPPPKDATERIAQQQQQTVTEVASRAAAIRQQAEKIAAGVPPPVKPSVPSPQGMDNGQITQETVDRTVKAISALPPAAQPKTVLEVVGNLAKRMLGMKTVMGPDGRVVNVDSPKSAQTEAIKIVNGEMDRQQDAAKEQAKAQKEAAKQKSKALEEQIKQRQKDAETARKDAETAQGERDKALNVGKPTGEGAKPVDIPDTRQTRQAREALRGAGPHATAKHLDAAVRGSAMVSTEVRKALVEEEVARRANRQEDSLTAAMNGKPPVPGQSREELQAWATAAGRGEHPYVHVPQGSSFVPTGIEPLTHTKVNGAGAFSGTYHHAPEIDAVDIRKAARDKKDPQAALDALKAKWEEEKDPIGFTAAEAEPETPKAETEKPKAETKPAEPETKAPSKETPKGEEPATVHKYGNTQADIPPDSDAGKALAKLRAMIDPADLMGEGLVEDSHITVRYGIKDDNFAGIRSFVKMFEPFEATLGATAAFPASEHSDGAVPIIVPVEAKSLRIMEKEMDQRGNFAERSFPEYRPHATVAYVKPEAAHKYTGLTETEGKTFKVESVSISKRDGTVEEIKLKQAAKKPVTPQVAPIKGVTPLGAKGYEIRQIGGNWFIFKDGKQVTGAFATKERAQADLDEAQAKPEQAAPTKPTKATIVPTRDGYVAVPEKEDAPKTGDKITFTDFAGKEREGTIVEAQPKRVIVKTSSGARMPIPVGRIKAPGAPHPLPRRDSVLPDIAEPPRTEDNRTPQQEQPDAGPESAPTGDSSPAAGRPAADSGSADRTGVAAIAPEVPENAGEGGNAPKRNPRVSSGLRADDEPVPGEGAQSGPGEGSDPSLDSSPARPVVAAAEKQARKRVKHNQDWFTHPDDWKVPGGELTRLENNIAALEILRAVEKEPRKLTSEEKTALANYIGWGSLAKAFDEDFLKKTYEEEHPEYNDRYSRYGSRETPAYKAERARYRTANEALKRLLTPAEFTAARESTINAHYTSPELVRFMWQIAQRVGFKSGNVMEPSMGVGNFWGMMPEEIRNNVHAIGNEMDPVTFGIAKLLYPGATMFNKDFVDLILPNGEIDFAIGNVPFFEGPTYDPKYPKLKAPLHDYFFVKTMDKVKPGGMIAFITSTGTMDKQNSTIRALLASQADLVTAFRLPSSAFQANAGTSVTTDMIILRKRMPDEKPGGEAWLKSTVMDVPIENDEDETHQLAVNEYFQAHPDHMLGTAVASKRMYGSLNFSLKPGKAPLEEQLKVALLKVPKGVLKAASSKATGINIASTEAVYASDNVLEKQYVVDKGEVKQRVDGVLVPTDIVKDKDGKKSFAKLKRVKALIVLRDKANELFSTMRTTPDDEPSNARIARMRAGLQSTYDKFVADHGYLNTWQNGIIREDPHYPRLLALENYDRAAKQGTPADIFRKRTMYAPEHLKSVSSDPLEALQQILGERGYPDINLMAALQGKTPEEAAASLVKAGLIYREPSTGEYQTKQVYLSGYVRTKLDDARKAVEQGLGQYQANVDALEKVQPEDLHITGDPSTSISVRLGGTWIPIPALEDFFKETFKVPAIIGSEKGVWSVSYTGSSPELTTQWATKRTTAADLITDALNLKETTIYDKHSDGTRTLNTVETTTARAMQEQIRKEFQKWALDSKWKAPLEKAYNYAFNNMTEAEYDGSHLKFPGMNPAITLKPHQINAIWRMIQDGRALLAHEVGAGKTFEMVAAVMEGKRLGTFKKPMIAVPNHIVDQFRNEFLLLYPGANILVPTEKDFDSKNRQRVMSQIATGDYDCIILPHSQFNLLDISPARQMITIGHEMEELEEALRSMKRADPEGKSRPVKAMEKSKKKLKESLKKLADLAADKAINFDDTGIDALFIDEAHEYKNLAFHTKMTRISGLQQGNAKRALRLKMKTDYLQEINHGRGVFFSTGTPVQNTMAELYTMMKYVAPDVLERAGIKFFDDWAANFGATITAMELSADGRSFKARTKFARFQNVPELMQMFRAFADVKTAADLDLPRPELEGGKPIVVTVPGSAVLDEYVEKLMKRAERVRSGGVDPKTDNMLKITSEGRKAATDMRLLGEIKDEQESKINVAVEQMLREYKAGEEGKLTQMAFLDMYRSMDDKENVLINLYEDMRKKLIAGGVPADQIAVIGEHNTRIKRQALFDRVNKGEVRIILGSTQKMGAGTNAQRRLKALHHIDLTWRPGDLTQREGRILRQGNTNKSVRIYNYLTERSFDAYMAQTLQSKAEFLSQILSGKSKSRTMTDAAADMVMSLEEMKVAASGNPDVKLKFDLEMQRAQLEIIERGFNGQKSEAAYQIRHLELGMVGGRNRLKKLEQGKAKIDHAEGADGNGFALEVDGKTFTERKAAFEYLAAMKMPGVRFWMKLNGIEIGIDPTVIKKHYGSIIDDKVTTTEEQQVSYQFDYAQWEYNAPEYTMESLGRSIEARMRNLPSDIKTAKAEIEKAKGDIPKFQKIADRADFPEKPELDKVLAQLKEVEARLGLGDVNAGSQASGESVAGDVETEEPDVEVDEEEEANDEDEDEPIMPKRHEDPGGSMSFMGAAYAEQALNAAGRYAAKAAFATWADLTRQARRPGASGKAMGQALVASLYPAALATSGALDIMGKALGEPAMRIYEAGQFLHGVKKMFAGMSQAEQVEFVDRWQNGRPQPNPDLEAAQEFMRTILEQQRDREQDAINLGRDKKVAKLADKPNYFPNRYKVAPGQETLLTEDDQMRSLAQSRRPFEGSKSFMKQQRYTLAEAVADGGVPLGDPVDMLMRRLQEGAKFVAARYAWHNFKDQNLAMFLKNGKKIPNGYGVIDDKSANVWRVIQSTETDQEGENKTYPLQTGRWIMHDHAARLLNNYLSVDHIRGNAIGSAFVKLKNFSTEARLAISTFHWGYITVENMASGINLGLDKFYNQGVRGGWDATKMSAGLGDLGRSLVAPYTAIRQGGQMIQYARNPDEFIASPEGKKFIERYPDFPHLQELLFKGGLRWNIADNFRASFGDHCIQSWKEGELGKGLATMLPWLSHVIMKPLFEHYIPRSKWVFAVEMLANKLAQNSEAIALKTKTEEEIAREVAETTDNRFGELNWDSLYLNNNMRTTAQFFFRSASWKLGSWRGLAQAGKEQFTSKAFDDHMLEKLIAEGRDLNWAQKYAAKLPQLGVNAGWMLSMGMLIGTVGSVMTMATTHKFPWDWAKENDNGLPYLGNLALESMHPRISDKFDAHGAPIRMSFPTGLKDYEHGFEDPVKYFKSSESDVVANAWTALANEDAFGDYIYDPNDPIYSKLGQGLLYNMKGDFTPMSVSNWSRPYGPQDLRSKIERSTGLMGGAPKRLDRSAALTEAMALQRHEAHTPKQMQEYEYAKSVPPTGRAARLAERQEGVSYLGKLVAKLSYLDAQKVLAKATPEEKLRLADIMDIKERNYEKNQSRQ